MNNLIIDVHGTRRDILESVGRDFDANIERLEESAKIDSVIHDRINEGYDGFIIVTKDTDKAQKYFEKKFSNVDIAVCNPDGKMSLREVVTGTAQPETAAPVADTKTTAQPTPAPAVTTYGFFGNPIGLNKEKSKAARDWFQKNVFNKSGQKKVLYLRNNDAILTMEGILCAIDIGCEDNKQELSKAYKENRKNPIIEFVPVQQAQSMQNTCNINAVKGLTSLVNTVLNEMDKLNKELEKTETIQKIEASKRVDEVQTYLMLYKKCMSIPQSQKDPFFNGSFDPFAYYEKAKKIADDIGLGGAIDTFNQNVLDVDKIVSLTKTIASKTKPNKKGDESTKNKTVQLDKLKFKWHYTAHAEELYKALFDEELK